MLCGSALSSEEKVKTSFPLCLIYHFVVCNDLDAIKLLAVLLNWKMY